MGADNNVFVITYGLFVVVMWAIEACIAGVLASKKGRSVGKWILLSLLMGWLAVIILAFLQDLTVREVNHESTRKDFFLKREGLSSDFNKICMKCGNTLTNGSVCDMCGFSNNIKTASNQTKNLSKKDTPTPKIEKYKCRECCEIIDTIRCPWCGAKKSD